MWTRDGGIDWLPRIPSRFVFFFFFSSSSWNESDSTAGRNDGATSNLRRERHNNTGKTFCRAASPPWPEGILVVPAQRKSSTGAMRRPAARQEWWTMKNLRNVDLKSGQIVLSIVSDVRTQHETTTTKKPVWFELRRQFVKRGDAAPLCSRDKKKKTNCAQEKKMTAYCLSVLQTLQLLFKRRFACIRPKSISDYVKST